MSRGLRLNSKLACLGFACSNFAKKNKRLLAVCVDNYKDHNKVTSMEWPAQSADLNIIENIWLYMKRELVKNPNIDCR